MAKRGRSLVYERYDWDVLADKLEQTWERCVSGPRPSTRRMPQADTVAP
jgi:hypothetical protein